MATSTMTLPASPLSMVDTNVFVSALYSEEVQHPAAYRFVTQAESPDANFCITPQIVTEFYSTITNPRRVTSAFSVEEALQEVEKILAYPGITLLPVPIETVRRWIGLARQYQVSRGDIFDTQLVATMLEHQVRRLYTFNVDDFLIYPDIEVLEPPAP
jgi:predicted nucleic acid-binding protein